MQKLSVAKDKTALGEPLLAGLEPTWATDWALATRLPTNGPKKMAAAQ